MRIALFSDTYLPQVNGVSRTLARLVAHLRSRGDEVALVSPRIDGNEAAVHVHIELPSFPLPKYPELRLGLPMSRSLAKALTEFAPDVVHVATEFTAGWLGVNWAEANAVPLVSSFHTDYPAYLAGYGFAGLERAAWNYLRSFHEHAARTFCPSHATLAQLRAQGFHDRLAVWSRGVDATLFSPQRRCARVRAELAPGAERILLYVGRVAPEKRIDVAIDAYARIRARSDVPTALVVVGDGPATAALRGAPAVRFTGYLHGDALADAYAAADVFLFPSDTETFGNVVLEAMASGLPVVCADRGGVTDSVRPGCNGLLAAAGDAGAFADATLRILEDDALRSVMAGAARSDAEARSWSAILDGLRAEYAASIEGARLPLAA